MSLYGESGEPPTDDLRPQTEIYECGQVVPAGTLNPQQAAFRCTQRQFAIQLVSPAGIRTLCTTCRALEPMNLRLVGRRPTSGPGQLMCTCGNGVFELHDIANELSTRCTRCSATVLLGMHTPKPQ